MTTSAAAMKKSAGELPQRLGEAVARPHTRDGGLSLRALWALYVLTLRQHVHGRRWMVSAALFLLPAGLAVFVRLTSPDVPPRGMEFMFAFMFIPQALLPLVALLYASGVVQDEQEEQTITYLLVRPIPKWAMYVVKLAAAVTTTVLLTGLFTGLTYAAIYTGGATASAGEAHDVAVRSLKAVGIHALAVAAYCGAFGLISLLTRRVLIVGILYAVIVEGFLANLPLSVRLITVIYYARMIAYRSMGFVVETPGFGKHDLAAQLWGLDVRMDPLLLEHPTIGGSVMVLVGATVGCAVIGAFLCARREFHVKTPGKE
jgi:ABC-2 type transport system permease protein